MFENTPNQCLQITWNQDLVGSLQIFEVPPAHVEDVLGVELLPGEVRLRLETSRNANLEDLLSLAIELAIVERNDVQAIPDVATDRWILEPDLLEQLPTQRLMRGFACVDAAARQRPSRSSVGEVEPDQKHPLVAVDHERAHRLTDPERLDCVHPDLVNCGVPLVAVGSLAGDHSSGLSFRPSLNDRYIS